MRAPRVGHVHVLEGLGGVVELQTGPQHLSIVVHRLLQLLVLVDLPPHLLDVED